jgi:predicted DNA-binding protein with PD1-like motif
MTYKKSGDNYIIRLHKGEKVIETLTQFCVEQKIESGFFHGLGAVSHAQIGYYDLANKQYVFTDFDKVIYEVVSMVGNVALVDGKPFLHIHTGISDQELKMYGGHVGEMTVGVTVEVFLTPCEDKVERILDEEIGLKLFRLPHKCGHKK